MREFHPPVRPSTLRTIVAIMICLVLVAGLVPLALVALGSAHVTYAQSNGILVIDTASFLDGHRTIPHSLLREARAVTLRGARRTRGTGIPGYCTGHYTYADIGSVWQATDCSGAGVLLTTTDGDLPVVVTPPDRDAFLQALDTGGDFGIELPAPSMVKVRAPVLGVIFVAVVTSGLLVATLLLGPSRMVYRVGEGRMEVRTLFSRRSWATAGLRARAHAPHGLVRIAGTAVAGYYTGWYLEDGKRTRVYATDRDAGVLLEGSARVYISPRDRDGFLAACRAEGAIVDT